MCLHYDYDITVVAPTHDSSDQIKRALCNPVLKQICSQTTSKLTLINTRVKRLFASYTFDIKPKMQYPAKTYYV